MTRAQGRGAFGISRRAAGLAGALAALVALSLPLAHMVSAQEGAAARPHVPLQKTIGRVTPTGPVPSLAVINARGATLADGKLTLTGVSPNTIVFADRPVRAAGHVTTAQFVMQWDEDKNNFAANPPNATVSVLGGAGDEVRDAVVTLTAPKLEGDALVFDVAVLEGSLDGGAGPAALFIDRFAWGYGAGGFHGGVAHVGDTTVAHYGGYHDGTYYHGSAYHEGGWNYYHAPVYHGAWYAAPVYPAAGVAAGAAVGAAAGYAAGAAANPYPCGYAPYPPCRYPPY
jgi:hypothetical protein